MFRLLVSVLVDGFWSAVELFIVHLSLLYFVISDIADVVPSFDFLAFIQLL